MKATIINLTLIILLFSSLVFAQNRFSGKIVDAKTNEPLIGANISTKDKGITATDKNGYFNFVVSSKPKEFIVSYIGYKTLHLKPNELQGTIKMRMSTTKLGQVVVTGSSTIDVIKNLETESSSVEIVDEKAIEEIGPKNIIDVLKTVPGVTSVARAGEMVQFRFRGVGNQQYMGEKPGVAIVVDGVPVMSKSGGIRLNMQDIKSIKVIKGSASYLFGDAALSGALIITTKKEKNKKEFLFSTEFGSYGYEEYIASATQGNNNFTVNLNANYRQSDGYWTDAELWTKSINGKVAYYIDNSSAITIAGDKTSKFDEGGTRSVVNGETEALTNPKGAPNTAYTKDNGVDLDKYYITYNKYFNSNMGLQVTGYYYRDLYEETSNPLDLDNNPATPNIYVSNGATDLKQKGVKAEFTSGWNKLASLIGLEYGNREYINSSLTLADYSQFNSRTRKMEDYFKDELTKSNSKEEVKALYTELKYSFMPTLTATVNARYNIQDKDYITEEHRFDSTWSDLIDTQSETFNNTAFRFGLNYKLTENHSLYTSVATGYETPEIRDLTYYDRKTRTIIPTNIKDQTSITYELGVRGRITEDLIYDASIYEIDNKDIIGPLGGTYAFGDPKGNIGDSRHRGLEISLRSNQMKTFSFNLSYTFLDAIYTDHNPHVVPSNYKDRRATTTYDIVGNEIPRVSKHTGSLFLNYRVLPELKLIAEIYARSNYWADEMNTVRIDGYQLLNLQARYNATFFKGINLEFFAKVDNVFDNHYYRAAFLHRDKRGEIGIDREDLSITVDPGRVYYAGIKFLF